MRCKICELSNTCPKAREILDDAIRNGDALSRVIRQVNAEFGLDITPNNASRHKPHVMAEDVVCIGKGKKFKVRKIKKMIRDDNRGKEAAFSDDRFESILPQHKEFCAELINTVGMNYTVAYQRAYGIEDPNSAASAAYSLMRRTPILREYIAHLQAERAQWSMLKSETILDGLYLVYLESIQNEPIVNKEGKIIGTKMADSKAALKALELLGKNLGMFNGGIGAEQLQVLHAIIEKIISNRISPIAAGYELTKQQIPIPEMLKAVIAKMDPKLLSEKPRAETSDLSQMTDDELREIVARG